jgi:hypothetical protein
MPKQKERKKPFFQVTFKNNLDPFKPDADRSNGDEIIRKS